jgi:hypothetical protein
MAAEGRSLSVTLDHNFPSALASDHLPLFTALKSTGCPTMKLDTWSNEWAQVVRGLEALQQIEVTLEDKPFFLRGQLPGEASGALGARSEFILVSRLPRAILGSSNILNHRPENAVMGNQRHKQMRKTSSG